MVPHKADDYSQPAIKGLLDSLCDAMHQAKYKKFMIDRVVERVKELQYYGVKGVDRLVWKCDSCGIILRWDK